MFGTLKSPSGELIVLGRWNTLGSAAVNHVRCVVDGVSGRHAVLKWDRGWVLVDLNSRNGTAVNGRTILGPKRIVLGDRFRLGVLPEAEYTLVSHAEPAALARSVTGRVVIEGPSGRIFLPDGNEPEAVVYRVANGWAWMDAKGVERPVPETERLLLNEVWELSLPTDPVTAFIRPRMLTQAVLHVIEGDPSVQAWLEFDGEFHKLRDSRNWDIVAKLARRGACGDPDRQPVEWCSNYDLAADVAVSPDSLSMAFVRIRDLVAEKEVQDHDRVIEAQNKQARVCVPVVLRNVPPPTWAP